MLNKTEQERAQAAGVLLDHVMACLAVDSDAAMASTLDLSKSVISKIRNGRTGISDFILIRMHETTALPIRELKEMMQVPDKQNRA